MKQLTRTFGFLIGLAVIGSLLIGGVTVAAFTSEARSSGNPFVSGTLRVELDRMDGDPYLNLENIAPGDGGSTEMLVTNIGDLDVDYRLYLSLSGTMSEGVTPLELTVRDLSGAAIDLGVKRNLAAGDQDRLTLCWELPQEAGNAYQNTTAKLDLRVQAEQVAQLVGSFHP